MGYSLQNFGYNFIKLWVPVYKTLDFNLPVYWYPGWPMQFWAGEAVAAVFQDVGSGGSPTQARTFGGWLRPQVRPQLCPPRGPEFR